MIKEKQMNVGTQTAPDKLAGAIRYAIRDGMLVKLRTIGSGPTAIAGRAMALARQFMQPDNLDFVEYPKQHPIDINGVTRVALTTTLEVIRR